MPPNGPVIPAHFPFAFVTCPAPEASPGALKNAPLSLCVFPVLPIIVLETMQLWFCPPRGTYKGKEHCQYNVKAEALGPGSRKVQLKPEICFLLPHEVQPGGTLLQDFRTFSIGLCLKINSPPQKRMGACARAHTHTHTHTSTHTRGQAAWHSLKCKVEPAFFNWPLIKILCVPAQNSSQSAVRSFPPPTSLESPS